MNIYKKARAWADYCEDFDRISGFQRATPSYKLIRDGAGAPIKEFHQSTPGRAEMTRVETVKAVKEMDGAILVLLEESKKHFDCIIEYYFGSHKTHKERGESMGWSRSWFEKNHLIAHKKLRVIIDS